MVHAKRLVALLLATTVSAQGLFDKSAGDLLLTATTTSSTSSCDRTVCADFTNACGVGYGTCYAACPGYSTPTITPPACSKEAHPTITVAPQIAFAADSPTGFSETSGTCGQSLCIDYINTCNIKYGGCFPVCSSYTTPTFFDPGCPSVPIASKSFVTAMTNSCGHKCDLYVDQCGQTFGPGCYSTCSGVAPPSYTTPYCETSLVVPTSADMPWTRAL
ncbi:Hypothetical predicted protein [Lecanosticta acicola]|uniref:Uncharacterized protein n=1 Tax=Lecanosticta acicola TaxID=111012 RepID=A0AAI9E7Q8_9PEZI|nr:Hypothetical predicted protein [Lecanosticta acicola]